MGSAQLTPESARMVATSASGSEEVAMCMLVTPGWATNTLAGEVSM